MRATKRTLNRWTQEVHSISLWVALSSLDLFSIKTILDNSQQKCETSQDSCSKTTLWKKVKIKSVFLLLPIQLRFLSWSFFVILQKKMIQLLDLDP